VGVIVGSGIGGLSSFEESNAKGLQKGWDRLSPFFILQMISNMAPGRISMRYNCKGPNWGPVSATFITVTPTMPVERLFLPTVLRP